MGAGATVTLRKLVVVYARNVAPTFNHELMNHRAIVCEARFYAGKKDSRKGCEKETCAQGSDDAGR